MWSCNPAYAIFCIFVVGTVAALRPTLSKLPPHAGYHGSGADPRKPFFEGWYLRLVTKSQGSIALIFHVFDPHISRSIGTNQRQGVGLQVLTPSGSIILENSDVSTFRGDSHELAIRNYFADSNDYFRLTAYGASGRASSPTKSDEISRISFDFDIFSEIGWGGIEGYRQFSTAGWLAAFPVFEPHYQVLISKGSTVGSMRVERNDGDEVHYDLDDATVYLEKNWGGAFPSKWWWIQANTFASDLTVTSTAARRSIPLLGQDEEVALVGLHWNGEFLPFPNVEWTVQWGSWQITGEYKDYSVTLTGTCDSAGFPVNCPATTGMEPIAMETFKGTLRVQLFRNGSLVHGDSTDDACLEVGGIPWPSKTWTGRSAMKEPIKTVAMNVELERQVSDILQAARTFIDIPGL